MRPGCRAGGVEIKRMQSVHFEGNASLSQGRHAGRGIVRTWTARSITAVAVVGALALAGCNGVGDDPTTTTSSSSSTTTSSASSTTTASPSATTSATIDPAKLPPEATEHTPDGAVRFARYFLERYSEAAYEGDPTLMDGLSSKNCSGCAALRKVVSDRAAKEKRTDIDSMEIGLSQVAPGSTTNAVIVGLLVTDREKKVIDKDGKVVQTVKGAKFNTEATVVWAGNSWTVDALRLLQ
jgi:hypothetical protein